MNACDRCGNDTDEPGLCTACWDKDIEARIEPQSLAIAERGVQTGDQFASLMSALMGDVISGRLTPPQVRAAVSAGSQLLKIVEMQYRYSGREADGQPRRTLQLTSSATPSSAHLTDGAPVADQQPARPPEGPTLMGDLNLPIESPKE